MVGPLLVLGFLGAAAAIVFARESLAKITGAQAEVITTKGKAEAEYIAKQPPKAPTEERKSILGGLYEEVKVPQAQAWQETTGAGKERSQTYESGQVVVSPTGQTGQQGRVAYNVEGAATAPGFNLGSLIQPIVIIIVLIIAAIIVMRVIK